MKLRRAACERLGVRGAWTWQPPSAAVSGGSGSTCVERHTAGNGRRGPAGTQSRWGSIVPSATGARQPRTREAPLEVEDVYLVRANGDTGPAVKRLAERGQELLS